MSHQFSRRQMLAAAGATVIFGAIGQPAFSAEEPATAPTTAPIDQSKKRFKVAGDDEFLDNNRQKIKAFKVAQDSGLDGVSVDMGRMPGGQELLNELGKPEVRQSFLDESKKTGVKIASLSFFAMYAHVFTRVPNAADIAHQWVESMQAMSVKLGYMPLMTKDGTLREPEHAQVWKDSVDIFKKVAPAAEKAGVVLGVESNIDADGYKKFLDAVGSPAVQAFYNPGVGLENKFDVYADIKALGKDRVCALHLEQGSVPPEKFEHRLGDGLIDFHKLRDVLMEMEWGGWMSIARSRLKGTTSARPNMTANAKYVHDIFPE